MASTYWPWWWGGIALSLVAVGFSVALRRPFAVSGVFAEVLEVGPIARSTKTGTDGWLAHAVFIGSIAVGGLAAALATGRFGESTYDATFSALVGSGPLAVAALVGGGMLVGFGTQMAGGCTSGHGLVGCSRVQTGSVLATAAFFGTGVLVSFLLEWVMR